MNPYRGGERVELACPRCKKTLPPLDVATCACGGVWVTAFAATEVLAPEELRPDRVTRWWRIREPCPECGDQMMLHGQEPGLFQGCDLHGYFIDADMVEYTKLGRGIDHEALDRKRQDEPRVAAEREARELAIAKRAAERAQLDWREAELARRGFVREPNGSATFPRAAQFEERRANELERTLRQVLGDDATDLLLRRIRELEDRVAQLERRPPYE